MAKSVKLKIITPSSLFYEGEVEMVIVKTALGEEGFMAGHTWACKLLDVGKIRLQEAGQKDFKVAAVSGGFIDVKNNFVVYTDAAEWSEEIDLARAQAAKAKAEELLMQEATSPSEVEAAKAALARAENRIKVVEYAKGK